MIILLIFLPLLIFLLRTLQVAYFSPLSKFPNAHFLAPLTSLWLLYTKATRREIKLRDALHERLGPVVRLGPNELSVNDVKEVKLVYGGGFEKDDSFQAFVNFGENVMFSLADSRSHTERKRMLSHLYSKSHILTSPELSKILQTITTSIKSELSISAKEDKAVDIYKLTKAFGMDVTTAYLFGLGYGTNFVKEAKKGDPLGIFELGLSPDVLFWGFEAPGLKRWLERFGYRPLDKKYDIAGAAMENLCFNLATKSQELFKEKRRSLIDEEKRGEELPKTVYGSLYHKLAASYGDSGSIPKERLDKKAAAEMLDHMLAGNEGIGITLTYLILNTSTQPTILHRLRLELQSTPTLNPKTIDSLPLLDAIINETMRLHPAALGPFPRIVPSKGAEINGVKIPGGTKISSSAYSLHRNESVYPGAGEWRPERWLEEKSKKEINKWFWGFGSGGRMCIGNHLAVRMMKEFVVAVYGPHGGFESLNVEEMPEQQFALMGVPVRKKIFVRFREVGGV